MDRVERETMKLVEPALAFEQSLTGFGIVALENLVSLVDRVDEIHGGAVREAHRLALGLHEPPGRSVDSLESVPGPSVSIALDQVVAQ